jgi:hypothetical protein
MQVAPLKLLRLRRLVHAREARLNAQVDPLRRLIRKRNEQVSEILRRLNQVQEMRKGSGVGPTGDYWD